QAAWAVARYGLAFTNDRRDWAWAVLRSHDLDRVDADDPQYPGIVVDTPERREIAQFSPAFERNQGLPHARRPIWSNGWSIFESPRAALEPAGPAGMDAHIYWAGAHRDALPLAERNADAYLERGELAPGAMEVALCSLLRTALGDLALAERDLVRLTELAERAGNSPLVVAVGTFARGQVFYCRGTGLERAASHAFAAVSLTYWRAAGRAHAAVLLTFAGRDDDALRAVARALPAVERAGGGVMSYTALICRCCQALWRLGRTDFADVL